MIKRKKHRDTYDLESYINLLSAVFKDVQTKAVRTFLVFADPEQDGHSVNQIGDLIDFLEREIDWLIGFNNHAYDDVLLKYILNNAARLRASHPRVACAELKKLGDEAIKHQKKEIKSTRIYAIQRMSTTWRSIDLQMLFNPIDRVSLKRLAISLKWPIIEDLPFHEKSVIRRESVPHLVKYNINDVDMTERVKDELADNINNRIDYTVKFGTDIINSCNSQIGKRLIADLYEKHTGIPYSKFRKLETNYDHLKLRECIAPNIFFTTRSYQKVKEEIEGAVIDPNKKDEESVIQPNGKRKKKSPQLEVIVSTKYLTHSVMLGGIHSNGPAEIMEENDKYVYIDIDVEGYYPRIIDHLRLYPAHLLPEWTDILINNVVNPRSKIKKSEPTLAYVLKIGANAVFGLTDVKGEASSWLKDPKMAKTITLSGQLYLLMLIEGIEKYTKCLAVYSNTDGITVRVPREQLDLFYKICDRWMLYTKFKLEFVQYRKMIVRDVNNYLMFTYDKDKPIKAKGVYAYENTMATDLKVKGFAYPIVPMAVRAWYDKGIPVEETITSHQDIYDFMKAENTSPEKYDVMLKYRHQDIPDKILQKNNRWIVTSGNAFEGRQMKYHKIKGTYSEMQRGKLVTSVNNVDSSLDIADYKLDYDFYIQQAQALLDLTKPLDKETHIPPMVQKTLFA